MGIKDHDTATELSNHLRQLRETRGLTLVELAQESGVSRATLSRIENGETSPTAETLRKLATAFALPVSQLLAPMEPGFQPVLRREAQSAWVDPEKDFHRRSVSPAHGPLRVELIEARLGPSQRIAYDAPAVPGAEHHLYLLDGTLTVTVEGTAHRLAPGDCLRYRLYGATVFETGPDPARYLIALS